MGVRRGFWRETVKFRKGDIVRLNIGKSPAIVVGNSPGQLIIKYYRSGQKKVVCLSEVRPYDNLDGPIEDMVCRVEGFEHLNEQNTNKQKEENYMENKATLYQVTQGETVQYATKLAVNSAGKWVMEEKGTGTILTVDKTQAEEVMPHTISVVFSEAGQQYSFFAEAGEFEAGQYFLDCSFKIVKVTATDTKSKQATKDFKPVVQLTVK